MKIQEALRRLGFEFVLALILGGIPIFLAWAFGGLAALETSIAELAPKGFPLWYVVGLSVTGLCFLGLTAVFPPSPSPGPVRKVAAETYTEIRSVLRVGAGILVMFCLIWTGSSPSSLHTGALWFALLAIIALSEAAALTWLFEWVGKRNGFAP